MPVHCVNWVRMKLNVKQCSVFFRVPGMKMIILSSLHLNVGHLRYGSREGIAFCLSVVWLKVHKDKGFPGGPSGKEPTCHCRRHKRCRSLPLVGKIPWRRAWQLTPVFLPGESYGQRSLTGYSPWVLKESDMTEQLNWTGSSTYMAALHTAMNPLGENCYPHFKDVETESWESENQSCLWERCWVWLPWWLRQ